MRALPINAIIYRGITSLFMCFVLSSLLGCASGSLEVGAVTGSHSASLFEEKFHLEISHSSARLPVLLLFGGGSGPHAYVTLANEYADLGYDVVLLDGRQYHPSVEGALENLRTTIERTQQSPHALPGKVSVVGFSEGGGVTLGLASNQSDLVAQVIVYYPNTNLITDKQTVVQNITVPTLVFAGDADDCCGRHPSAPIDENCCNIKTIRGMASLAKDQGKPLDLVVYHGANHAFNFSDGPNFDRDAAADALRRTILVLHRKPKA